MLELITRMTAVSITSNQSSLPRQYRASGIGSKACDLIHLKSKGVIFGAISRGIFIKTDSRWLIFISYEPYPGPLTINVPAARDAGIVLEPGEQVDIASGRLTLKEDELVITTQHLSTWQPVPTGLADYPSSGLQRRLVAAAEIVTSSGKTNGLSVLLPYWMPIQGQARKGPEQMAHWYEIILNLVRNTNVIQSPASIIELLGAGPGLTPSGDDFTIGFLLTLNRWQHVLPASIDLDKFNQQVVSAAYQKTTTLSANLIECAAQGLADQRLVNALDWLVAGKLDNLQAVEDLLSWGNSSGGDAFVGFVVALSPWISELQSGSA